MTDIAGVLISTFHSHRQRISTADLHLCCISEWLCCRSEVRRQSVKGETEGSHIR